MHKRRDRQILLSQNSRNFQRLRKGVQRKREKKIFYLKNVSLKTHFNLPCQKTESTVQSICQNLEKNWKDHWEMTLDTVLGCSCEPSMDCICRALSVWSRRKSWKESTIPKALVRQEEWFMIQKIIVLNIIVYKNPGSRRKRFLRFSLSKKSIVDYFVLPFLQESHQNLCHSTVVEQWPIISLKHTLKELMLINQKWEKQTCFGNRNSVTTSKEHPLARGPLLLGRWLPDTGAILHAPTPTPSLLWYPLDWGHEWKVFKYLIFPVCPPKKGQCSCDSFSKAKLGREERKSGRMGEHGQVAMLRRGSLRGAWAMK